MFFNEIEIENYKCFKDKVSLKLEQGINIIVGKNSVGKTALLEALSLQFPFNPHKSTETFPKANRESQLHTSKVSITFTLEKDELLDLLLIAQRVGNTDFKFPLHKGGAWDIKVVIKGGDEEAFNKKIDNKRAIKLAERFFSYGKFSFKLQREAYNAKHGNWYVLSDTYVYPKFQRAEENSGKTQHYLDFQVNTTDRDFIYKEKNTASGAGSRYLDDFTLRIVCELEHYIYRFRAERIPSEPCPLEHNKKLSPDSRNLAEVLNLLQGNTSNFNKLNKFVKEIFPNIFQVGVQPLEIDNLGQVVIWNSKKASEHNHLGFTLDQVGSGVGQVISILYVLLTSDDPQVILIDEPQSFLHPDAARKLIEVLRHYAEKHQIIIATHSPTIITSADPSTVTLVKQKGSKSVLQQIDIKKVDNQRIYLGEIGARLSDVFGYDRIIWVEGLTEEICFPKILKKLSKKPLLGTAILQVHRTGDFEKKDKSDVDRAIDIYERLSSSDGGLVPDAIGYIFDKEDHSEKEISEKKTKYPKLHFTGKRLYENYLLNPNAIANVINQIEGNYKTDSNKIELWLEQKRKVKKYYQPFAVPTDIDSWTETIHGKRLLKKIFEEFCTTSENKNYKVKIHSVMLTEWILENSENELAEIAKLIEGAMKSK